MQVSSSPAERAAARSTWLVLPLALVPVTLLLMAGADMLRTPRAGLPLHQPPAWSAISLV